MRLISYKLPLTSQEASTLQEQFPGIRILQADAQITPVQAQTLEVLCTNQLEETEFQRLTALQWIHIPGGWSDQICWDALLKRPGLIITVAPSDPVAMGEWFLALVLDHLRHLPSRTLLQIGLGAGTSEICRIAKQAGMTTWAVHAHRTFLPHCDRVYSIGHLPELLPRADCTVLATPFSHHGHPWLNRERLFKLRPGSLLLLIHASNGVDWKTLTQLLDEKRLSGAILDGQPSVPLPTNLNRGHACIPLSDAAQFLSFLRNLRHYAAGDTDRLEGRILSELG
jgi:phosphoglycerate dehydrogenase-like enzyme